MRPACADGGHAGPLSWRLFHCPCRLWPKADMAMRDPDVRFRGRALWRERSQFGYSTAVGLPALCFGLGSIASNMMIGK
jgi:hypothetical protein